MATVPFPSPGGPSMTSTEFYFPFIRQMFAKLNCEVEGNADLWHYTTGSNLIEIIQSGELYATQVACLNDRTEIRYAERLLRDALQEILPTVDGQSELTTFIQGYIARLTDTDDLPSHRVSNYFVTCFSGARDSLSQWRSYSGGENGMAIRFKAGSLKNHEDLTGVVKVNYDEGLHRALALEVAHKTCEFFSTGLEHGYVNWEELFLNAWTEALYWLSPLVKHPSFASESEMRAIYRVKVPDSYARMKFHAKKTLLSTHLPYRYPADRPDDSKVLPIEEIMIGPSRHRAVTSVSVNSLLMSKGYAENVVTMSDTPFQDV